MDTWNGKPLVPLDENESLKPGEVILIKFAWLIDGDWYRAYQWGVIEKKLEGRRDWRVVSYRNEGEYLWAEIEVLPQQQPQAQLQQASLVPVAAGVVLVSVAIISVAFIYGTYALSKDRQTQWRLVEAGVIPPPVSSVAQAATGFKVLSYAALIVAGGWVVSKVLRR